MKKGYTILELLAVLTILSIVSTLAINNVQQQLERYALSQDASILVHTLETAKNNAMLTQQSQELAFNNQMLTLTSPEEQLNFSLSGESKISFAGFPKRLRTSIIFTPTGNTEFQNGTFTLTSIHGFKEYIVINQGGRVYRVEHDQVLP